MKASRNTTLTTKTTKPARPIAAQKQIQIELTAENAEALSAIITLTGYNSDYFLNQIIRRHFKDVKESFSQDLAELDMAPGK